MSDDNKEGAAEPVALDRYAEVDHGGMRWHTQGEWVRYEDVVSLKLATPPAVMPAAPSDAVPDALADLRAAVTFLDQVRAAHDNGDDVNGTGAAKDARQWLERAARAALTQTTTVQQAPTDEELAAAAYKGFDDYWTEDCAGKESEAWLASAKAVLALKGMQPGERKEGV